MWGWFIDITSTAIALLEVSDTLFVVLAAGAEVVLVGVERQPNALALLPVRGQAGLGTAGALTEGFVA